MLLKYGLLLFDSTSLALKAERVARAAGVTFSVIPTPSEYSSGCGIALLLDDDQVAGARRALEGCKGHRLKYPYVRGVEGRTGG